MAARLRCILGGIWRSTPHSRGYEPRGSEVGEHLCAAPGVFAAVKIACIPLIGTEAAGVCAPLIGEIPTSRSAFPCRPVQCGSPRTRAERTRTRDPRAHLQGKPNLDIAAAR